MLISSTVEVPASPRPFPQGHTVPSLRGVDGQAGETLDRLQRDPLLCLLVDDAILSEHLLIDILPGDMGVGGEHVVVDVPPHHQLDYRLIHPVIDEVRDVGVAEDVGCDVLLDSRACREVGQLSADSSVP